MFSAFDNLIGQEKVAAILRGAVEASRNQFESHKMTHAWIFTGPPGSSQSSVAMAFAQSLICANNGCGVCNACNLVATGGHPDVEIVRAEGLSIKMEEVRELLTRVAWAPSMGGWRVVIVEEADRLTESSANALLKGIEEPGTRTVWLLCAPTFHDVLPTIRSRCRHMKLRTPSLEAVRNILVSHEFVAPEMAEFVARVSQGDIGRARDLAVSETARINREIIMQLPLQLETLTAAFKAGQMLVDLATKEANASSEVRDEREIEKLEEAYGKGTIGRGMATGGAKAVKELEREQKLRSTRKVRDSIDRSLLDLITFYRDVMMVQSGNKDFIVNTEMAGQIESYASNSSWQLTIDKLSAVLEARAKLIHNAAPLVTCEALMCRLAKK